MGGTNFQKSLVVLLTSWEYEYTMLWDFMPTDAILSYDTNICVLANTH